MDWKHMAVVGLSLALASCGSGGNDPSGEEAMARLKKGTTYDLLIEWPSVDGAANYRVYRDTACTGTQPLSTSIALVPQKPTPNFEDKTVHVNVSSVCYEVSSLAADGTESVHGPRVTAGLK